MVIITKEILSMERKKVEENSFLRMEGSMMDIGRTVKNMELESLVMLMVKLDKADGNMT